MRVGCSGAVLDPSRRSRLRRASRARAYSVGGWAHRTGVWGVRLLAVLGVSVGGVLGGTCAADALSARGHVFGFTFGGMGSGDGELREPAGVAVRESTGEVFVADRGNDRVAQFRPRFGSAGEVAGEEFVAVWGWGVKDGEERFERCAAVAAQGSRARAKAR